MKWLTFFKQHQKMRHHRYLQYFTTSDALQALLSGLRNKLEVARKADPKKVRKKSMLKKVEKAAVEYKSMNQNKLKRSNSGKHAQSWSLLTDFSCLSDIYNFNQLCYVQ